MVITKIQAATDVKIITRLAAYIRVSSDSEEQQHSFSAQYRYYNSIAADNDDTILIDIYADEGITGTCTDKRDEFKRMMSDARKHKFDRIIVKSVTRFARNTKDCLEAVRELKQLGIHKQSRRLEKGRCLRGRGYHRHTGEETPGVPQNDTILPSREH